MALSEVKQKLCELYAYKEDLKLTHELMAVQLGISTKSIQRYLKEPDSWALAHYNSIGGNY